MVALREGNGIGDYGNREYCFGYSNHLTLQAGISRMPEALVIITGFVNVRTRPTDCFFPGSSAGT
jgi:hypothetical protein